MWWWIGVLKRLEISKVSVLALALATCPSFGVQDNVLTPTSDGLEAAKPPRSRPI